MSNEYFPIYTFDPMEQIYRECSKEVAEQIRKQAIDYLKSKKEVPTMQVTYNGFTGELVKLERSCAGKFEIPIGLAETANVKWLYDLSLYDSEKQATISFAGVKLEDVKFLGGAVAFGG